jgi:hypothetical protein
VLDVNIRVVVCEMEDVAMQYAGRRLPKCAGMASGGACPKEALENGALARVRVVYSL